MAENRQVLHSGCCQCGAVRYALYAEPYGTHNRGIDCRAELSDGSHQHVSKWMAAMAKSKKVRRDEKNPGAAQCAQPGPVYNAAQWGGQKRAAFGV